MPEERNNAESGFVPVNGSQLYYEISGRGRPLVLIHGGLLDRRMWDQQIDEFSRHYRVIRYDIRGFGRSPLLQYPQADRNTEESGVTPRPVAQADRFSQRDPKMSSDSAPGQTPYSDVEDLHALLTHLGITHAYVLGLSMGGGIALDFALAHPEMVDALILAASAISGYEDYPPEAVAFGEQLEQAARAHDLDRLYELWATHPGMPQPEESPEAARRYREMLREYDFGHYLHPELRQQPERPALNRLTTIRLPTLVLIGDEDTIELQAMADLLEAGIIDVKKVTFHGARHMLNMERPELFNRAVITFLRRLEEGL